MRLKIHLVYMVLIMLTGILLGWYGYNLGYENGVKTGKLIGYYQAINEQPQYLKFFDNLTELKQFLEEDDTDKYFYVPLYFDCDDFAIMLQVRALKKGYIMNIALVDTNGDGRADHVMNLAILNTKQYVLIEPQTDRIWVINDTPEVGINYFWPEVKIR